MPYIPFFRKTNSDRAIFIMKVCLVTELPSATRNSSLKRLPLSVRNAFGATLEKRVREIIL